MDGASLLRLRACTTQRPEFVLSLAAAGCEVQRMRDRGYERRREMVGMVALVVSGAISAFVLTSMITIVIHFASLCW